MNPSLETKRSVEHCTPHANGAPLHFIGFAYILKFYLLPMCWQSVEEVALRFNLQQPISRNGISDQILTPLCFYLFQKL